MLSGKQFDRFLHFDSIYQRQDHVADVERLTNIVRETLRAYRVTQAQAARICRVSERHVRRWCTSPDRPSARLIPVKRWWKLLSVLEALPTNFKAFPRYQRDAHIERLRGGNL